MVAAQISGVKGAAGIREVLPYLADSCGTCCYTRVAPRMWMRDGRAARPRWQGAVCERAHCGRMTICVFGQSQAAASLMLRVLRSI